MRSASMCSQNGRVTATTRAADSIEPTLELFGGGGFPTRRDLPQARRCRRPQIADVKDKWGGVHPGDRKPGEPREERRGRREHDVGPPGERCDGGCEAHERKVEGHPVALGFDWVGLHPDAKDPIRVRPVVLEQAATVGLRNDSLRVVRKLADDGDAVAPVGEVLGEALHARLGGTDLGREVLRDDDDSKPLLGRLRASGRGNTRGRPAWPRERRAG